MKTKKRFSISVTLAFFIWLATLGAAQRCFTRKVCLSVHR